MDWKQSWIWRLARWYFSLDLLPLDILSEWLNQNSIQKHLNRSWLRESIHWLNNLRDDNKSPVVAHNKLPSELLDHNHPISVRSCGHCCCYCPWPGNGLIIQSSRSVYSQTIWTIAQTMIMISSISTSPVIILWMDNKWPARDATDDGWMDCPNSAHNIHMYSQSQQFSLGSRVYYLFEAAAAAAAHLVRLWEWFQCLLGSV